MKKLEYYPIIGEVVRYHYDDTEYFTLCYVLNIVNNICYLYDGNQIIAIEIQHITRKDLETGKQFEDHNEISYNTICKDCQIPEADYILKRL